MGTETFFLKLIDMVEMLRGENGCPWDKEQSMEDWVSYFMEEAEEVKEAMSNNDFENLKEELGDALYLILMISQVAKEKGLFTIEDVMKEVIEKIERRHPHVFGNVKAESADEALKLFYEAKRKEKKS